MREVSARMPPSPSLSVRITKTKYLMLMMITSDQKMSESTPRTLSGATTML